MKKKKRFSLWVLLRRLSLAIAGSAAALSVLLYRLASLAPILSPGEKASYAASSDWHKILSDPTNAPFKTLQWLVHYAPHEHVLVFARLPSVVLALVAMVLFVYILQRWYGRRSMIFGFAILLCSAWWLHTGRFAGPDIVYLTGMLALLAVHVGLQDHEDNPFIIFGWLLTNVILLMIPGFVWFVILGVLLQIPTILNAWQNVTHIWQRLIGACIVLAGLAVPIFSTIRTPGLVWTWLGLPAHAPSWRQLPAQFGRTLEALVYHGPNRPELWLGGLPLLDIFLFAMFAAGCFFYARHLLASRTHLLAGVLLIGIILISLGGPVGFGVLIPVLYLIAVAGIAYILHFWLAVFPRNPLARAAGIGLVACVVMLSCFYGLTQYFVAWPHNPETASIYQHPNAH